MRLCFRNEVWLKIHIYESSTKDGFEAVRLDEITNRGEQIEARRG